MTPSTDQVEITLFGPGYGECVIIHLGNNHWVIIDSCIDFKTRQPVALNYFNEIGINPAEAVCLIIASHWHDDHIRGLSQLLEESKNARFCCSAALRHEEFIATVYNYEERNLSAVSSGLKEIFEIYKVLRSRSAPGCITIPAMQNKPVFSLNREKSGHNQECRIWTLSPSDLQYQNFLNDLKILMPEPKESKRRATLQGPNHIAVVAWISIGDDIAFLIGSDLEETNDENTGWSVIVKSEERPQGKASIFKIPHHGSINAHCDAVWEEMITKSSIAILSPYCLGGKKLPTRKDVQRIIGYTKQAYTSSSLESPVSKRNRPVAVNRTIRETVGKIREAEQPTGWVRLRNGGKQNPTIWCLELSNNASPLIQIYDSSSGKGKSKKK